MSSGGSRAGDGAAPALAVLALLATAGALLAQQGTVLVHQCVSAGALGRLGLSLALLRTDAVCPAGTVGVGDGRRVVGVVVAVALPVLVAHLAGAVLGIGAASRLNRVLGALVAAVRALPARVAEPRTPSVAPALPVDVPVRLPGTLGLAAVPWRRGPPAVGLA